MTGFHTTRWSLVLAAQTSDAPEAARALGELCEVYWYPLYAFLRRKGSDEHDALDAVQGFVVHLLDSSHLQAAPERGRFRGYLLAALRHYVANERRRTRAEKRGGDRATVSLDTAEAAGRYARDASGAATPEAVYERQWALTVLERAFSRLRAEYAARGRANLFDALKPSLMSERDAGTLGERAGDLGITESAAKVTAHRMRLRMRQLIRDEIGQTVATPDEVDEEQQRLFDALGPLSRGQKRADSL